jgi:hypothetical protein
LKENKYVTELSRSVTGLGTGNESGRSRQLSAVEHGEIKAAKILIAFKTFFKLKQTIMVFFIK